MLLFTLSLSLNMVLANQDKVELYQQKRQEYLSKEVQNRNILSEIYEMQKSLRKINQEKNKLFTNKKNIDDQIAKLEPVVNKANKNISDQRIKIQKRLQYIYKFQDMGLLKVLFTAQAPSELDRNLRILKNITEEDYQNLKRYFKNVKTLRIKQNELNNKKEVVLAMEKQIVLKEKQLVAQSTKKNSLLDKIEKQKENLLTTLKGIRTKNSKNLEDTKREEFLSAILDPLFFERKGSLLKPTRARVHQGYGEFSHPVFNTKFRHKGIFFKSSSDNVRSIAEGKVAHIERIMGQGYTAIVDHGDHYYSVYSYLSDINVALNDKVLEGQQIGETGAQHPFFGPGLYFELRHFSEPMNPQEWIKL